METCHKAVNKPLGLSLDTICVFIDRECGGKDFLRGWSTARVNEVFVAPKTAASKVSYSNFLLHQQHPGIGPATVFVSHAWQCSFIDIVDALTEHLGREREVFVWFDVFCFNQHETGELSASWFSISLRQAIRDIGRVVLVLSPWSDPMPLTRTWCLYESFCALEASSTAGFGIAMLSNDRQMLINVLKESGSGGRNIVETTFKHICTSQSKSWNPKERRKMIDALVKAAGSLDIVDSVLYSAIRDWLISVVSDAVTALTKDDDGSELHAILATLYKEQGSYTEAEPLLISELARCRGVHGEDHPDTLSSLHNLAFVYWKQHRLVESEPLYVECLALRNSELGKLHPETLSTMHDLAQLYRQQMRYTEAEPLYEARSTRAKTTFGEDDPRTLRAMNDLANIYFNQGIYAEAEPLYVECLAKRNSVLGKTHPDSLVTMQSLAGLYEKQCRYLEAEPLYEACLAKANSILGEGNAQTLVTANNLAGLYERQGRYSDAEVLYKRCMNAYKDKEGEDSPYTLIAANNLAYLYESQGRYHDATPLYESCLSHRQGTVGDTHPDTQLAMNNLAGLYESQGRYSAAEHLYCRCLELRRDLLGGDHPRTLTSMNNLAYLYESMGRYVEAEHLYTECMSKQKAALSRAKGTNERWEKSHTHDGIEHTTSMSPNATTTSAGAVTVSSLIGTMTKKEDARRSSVSGADDDDNDDHVLGAVQSSTNINNSLLITMNNLACLYETEGKLKEAESLGTLTVNSFPTETDDLDLGVVLATSMNNLALVYMGEGRHEEAKVLLKKCLDKCRTALGEGHFETVSISENLRVLQQAISNKDGVNT